MYNPSSLRLRYSIVRSNFLLSVVSALLLLFARESLCVHTRNTHRVTVNPLPFEYALPTIKTVSALNSEPAGLKDLPVLMFLLPPWLSLSLFLVPCVCDSVRLVSSRSFSLLLKRNNANVILLLLCLCLCVSRLT